MAEDRISSIIDTSAIEAEIAKVEGKLTELSTTLKAFPKANLFQDAGNPKELNDANRQLSTVLDQLKVKNAELTVAIKEQNLAAKEAVAQKKLETQAAKDAANAAKQEAAERKAASKQAQIDGQERLRQLAAEKKAAEDLAAAEVKRNEAEQQALSGTFTAGSSAPKKSVEQFVPTNASDSLALSLVQDQRQLQATKEAQKLLSAEFAAGNLSQAEYDAQLVKSIQLQNDLKISIANTTKELSLQAKENLSIPGTIQGLQARNAVLGQQASQINVVNASPEDVAQLKTLNDEIDKNNELIRVNKDLLAQQKINIGNYPTALGQTFKTLNTELEQVQGKLVQGNFGAKETEQLTAKQTVLQNALSLTGKTFKSSAAEATAYKEAAVQIGQVYGKDSSIFKQFAEGVKTGAANTKALANEVAGVASKGKGFVSFLSAAWSGVRKLAYAIPGLGIGGVVLLLLGPLQAAGEAIYRAAKKSISGITDLTEAAQKKLELYKKASAEVNETYIKSSTATISKLQLLRDVITDTSKTEKERLSALHDYNKIADKNNQLDATQLKNLNLINDSISRQIDLVAKRALAAANEKILVDKAVALQLAEQKASESADKELQTEDYYNKQYETAESAKTDAYFKNLKREGRKRQLIAKDQGVIDAQAAFDAQKQVNAEFLRKNGYIAEQQNDETKKGLTKGHADTERLLDQFRKKDLEALSKYSNEQLKIIQDQNKRMANDEQLSLQERLDYEQKYYKASLALLENQKKTEQDALNLEADTALKNAKKIKDPKLRADTDIAIEKYRTDELKNIDQKFSTDSLKLNQGYYDDNVRIAEQSYDKLNKIAQESAKFRQDQEKIAFQNQKDNVDIDKNNQLLQLQKDFQNGSIKSIEDYNARKEAIEQAADLKKKQLDLKRVQDAEKIFEALYPGFKNQNFIKEALDLEVEINQIADQKILDSKKERAEKEKELARDLADFIESALLSSNQNQQDKLEKQSQDIDKQSQKQIDAINASTLAEADKQKRITEIEKQASFQHEQIQKRQDKLDQQRKLIQRLANVAEVGAGIAKEVFDLTAKAAAAKAQGALLASNPLTAAYAPIAFAAAGSIAAQIPFILGAGALALVKAAAFKKGTQNAPKGPAWVGEEGSELIVDRSGKMFVTPSGPSLIDLAGGEKIFRHDETEKILNHYNLLHIIQQANNKSQPVKIEDNFNKKAIDILNKIERKAPFIIQVQNGMETSDYYLNNIKR